ncbi:MAG: hypothetical protein J7L76_07340 [Spirochaetaceae bacterium]|nr:hypothetical protein [Spirochaetaceae bacterium]RKX74681.1 MAG: hypothetical protein DRP60_09865 [Spirochaetota bacterium]RKX78709.1 MAG: hypothetical protein DRP49_00405 [Spirochaetota bacterium]RKX86150.1 MAG: hypothetical protein DRP70_10620 [Spirochaetota bacterium]RKX97659.1 MAG: hypothetical protein DRZ90_05560 [Spirochaetota bacterium]
MKYFPGLAARLTIIILFFLIPSGSLFAWKVQYAEQFYKLYHQQMYRYPEDSAENIYYLSMALKSPFANPLNALATIEDKKEWEKYRNLFEMHVYLRITDEYLAMAARYDKFNAYFYNYPWKSANLDSLRTAESYYKLALETWELAQSYSQVARENRFRWINLEEIQYWEDEAFRIEQGDLDYRDIIENHLSRLERVRDEFKNMDYDTY